MDILDLWTRALEAQRKSPATITNYRTDADWLTFHMAGLERGSADRESTARDARLTHPIEDAKRGDIEDFIVASIKQGLADATVARRYRSLQQLFNFLVEVEEVDVHPMEKMKPPKMADTEPPIISPDDMARLLDACSGKLADGGQRRRNYTKTKLVEFEVRRDTALVQVLRTTGVRASELMGLAVDDLNLNGRTFKVIGKGSKIRNIALLPDASTAIDRYLLTRRRHQHADHPALWIARKGPLTNSGLAQMLRRRCADAGIEPINPHAFRHTFAHNAKVGGMSDEDLMTTAGWRSTQMLQRYGRAASEERAQTAHRKMFEGER
jgi:site-specific recombinase XerD